MSLFSLGKPVRGLRMWTIRAALTVVGVGLAAFIGAALLVRGGAPAWDEETYRALNDVSPGVATWLTPFAKLFLPAGIAVAALVAAIYSSVRTRTLWPIAFGALAAAGASVAANLAKHAVGRTRPYLAVHDAVLRQAPPHGTSFPSSHATVTAAVILALLPFLSRWASVLAIAYAVALGWSRIYLGVHYPLDVLAGLGIGCAIGGAVVLLEHMLLSRWTDTPARQERGRRPNRDPFPDRSASELQYGVGM